MRDGGWTRWGRWVTLAACVCVGAGAVGSLPRWQDRPAVGAVVGAVNVLLLVHLYGLGVWAALRFVGRRRAWSYRRAAYSPAVLGFVLLATLALPGLRALDNARPDPVGKKLAGASREISAADRAHLHARWPLGVRLSTATTRVLNDYYRSPWLSRASWVQASRPRLLEARTALTGLRRHTRALADAQMRDALDAWDAAGAAVVVALGRLHGAVAAHQRGAALEAQRLASERMGAFVRVSDRLLALVRPYLTQQQRDVEAATAEIIRDGG